MPTTDISEQILIALRRVTRAVDSHSRRLAQHHGLTGPQALIMKAVRRDEGLGMGELARRMNLSQATVTDVAKRLESRGLLERHRNDRDRRRVGLFLTPAGRTLLQDPLPLLQEHFLAQLHELEPWEQTQLLSSLQRIAQMMGAEDLDVAPLLASGGLTASPEAVVEATGPTPRNRPAEGERR